MRILFLDAYFEPEIIAYTHLEKDLIECLIKNDFNIDVICPIPTRGVSDEIRDKYKSVKRETQHDGKLTINRFWAPQEGRSAVIRALRYFWCNLRTYQLGIRAKEVDVVFSNSTPPTQGLLSGMVAKRLSKKYGRKVSFIYNLQDIFPDSLVNTGLSKEGSIIWKVGRRIENITYKNADKIIVISNGFRNNILSKGVAEEKVEVISNWIDTNEVVPIERENNKLINELGIDSQKFLVVYAGNFGESQGAEIVFRAAEKLESKEDIQFVVFGGGQRFDKAKVEAAKLNNVVINELLPQDRIPEVYSLGDIALITCKKGTGRAGLPSKLWSIMACNTTIIASFDTDSDLAMIIDEAKAGCCIEPEREDLLIDKILDCQKTNALINSRDYVIKHADKERCTQRYLELIIYHGQNIN